MSIERIGIVCRPCKHFNSVFSMEKPETLLEMHTEAEKHSKPETCEECGASLHHGNWEPESERRRVAKETARVKQETVDRAWGGRR